MASEQIDDPKTLVRSSYDTIAPQYLDFISRLPSPNIQYVDKLLSSLPSPAESSILELGCGNGIPVTKHHADRVKHITANDISAAQLDIAKVKLEHAQNIDYVHADMTELDFRKGQFDGVLALYSLIHLPREEQPAMVRKIHSWLAKGGILLCNFDKDEDPGTIMDDWLGTRMFKSGFAIEESKKMIQDAGFDLLEAEVVSQVDGKKTVPFLWILAKKRG